MAPFFQHPSLLRIRDYTYPLPDQKIAKYPLSERDDSRLLVFRDGGLQEDIYRNIADYLPSRTLLLFNQTKVIHARLIFQKPTGGRIEVFCLEPDSRYDMARGMQQVHEVYWNCLVGGAAKWKPGQVLLLDTQFSLKAGLCRLTVHAELVNRVDDVFLLKMSWASDAPEPLSFSEVLQYSGNLPIPPYLNRAADKEDDERYQTIFAREEGSVAAPTAALHFTPRVMERLEQKEIRSALLTLHVGAGTFKPVKSEQMKAHGMHAEWMEISAVLIEQLLQQKLENTPVVAVGTTSARALESLYWIGVRILKEDWSGPGYIAVPQWYPYDHPADVPVSESLGAVLHYLQMMIR